MLNCLFFERWEFLGIWEFHGNTNNPIEISGNGNENFIENCAIFLNIWECLVWEWKRERKFPRLIHRIKRTQNLSVPLPTIRPRVATVIEEKKEKLGRSAARGQRRAVEWSIDKDRTARNRRKTTNPTNMNTKTSTKPTKSEFSALFPFPNFLQRFFL